jgi:hypothetical protein
MKVNTIMFVCIVVVTAAVTVSVCVQHCHTLRRNVTVWVSTWSGEVHRCAVSDRYIVIRIRVMHRLSTLIENFSQDLKKKPNKLLIKNIGSTILLIQSLLRTNLTFGIFYNWIVKLSIFSVHLHVYIYVYSYHVWRGHSVHGLWEPLWTDMSEHWTRARRILQRLRLLWGMLLSRRNIQVDIMYLWNA